MGKKQGKGIKIPKKVLGFKLSKGTRKDLRKLLGLLDSPEGRAIAVSAASAIMALLAEKMAERNGPLAKVVRKASAAAQSH